MSRGPSVYSIDYHVTGRKVQDFFSVPNKKINILKPTGYVMHQQFNLLKPTGYVMHQQFNILKPTGYVMHNSLTF